MRHGVDAARSQAFRARLERRRGGGVLGDEPDTTEACKDERAGAKAAGAYMGGILGGTGGLLLGLAIGGFFGWGAGRYGDG